MAFTPQRDFDVAWAFSTKKQTDYPTILAPGDLTLRTPISNLDLAQIQSQFRGDAAKFGKGHEFGTQKKEVNRDLRLGRQFDLSSQNAGWLIGLVTGKVVTTGAADPWTHVFTFMDPATAGKDAVVTTIHEDLGAVKRYLHAMACNDITVSGSGQGVAQIQGNFIGSGNTSDGSGFTPPSVLVEDLMTNGNLSVLLGTQAAPVDISERVQNWSYTLSQNLNADLGHAPGGGKFRVRIWIGQRTVSVSLRVFVKDDADLYDISLGGTKQELQINLSEGAGDQVNAKFPAVILNAAQFGFEDGYEVYELTSGDDGVLKDAGATPAEPIEITVLNDIAAHLN